MKWHNILCNWCTSKEVPLLKPPPVYSSGGVTGPVGPVLTEPLFDAIVYYICNVCMWFSDLVLYTL